jgi:hypothetical protein
MSLAHQWNLERKARLARMSGRPVVTAETAPDIILKPIVSLPPERRRREYETAKTPSAFMPLSQRILRAVADEFDMNVHDMTSSLRGQKYVQARFVVVGILLEMTQMSMPAIGRRLGGRDHTTMIHARNKARILFAEEAFRNRVDQIKAWVLS